MPDIRAGSSRRHRDTECRAGAGQESRTPGRFLCGEEKRAGAQRVVLCAPALFVCGSLVQQCAECGAALGLHRGVEQVAQLRFVADGFEGAGDVCLRLLAYLEAHL